MYHDVIMAGFGGQGILLIGDLLALTAMNEGRHVTWMPSYGVEMRGGVANCTVVISSERIGSPITGSPYSAIVMNRPSLLKFAPRVKSGGVLIVNGSFMTAEDVPRSDLDALTVPTSEIALEIGDGRLASMVALGAFIEKTRCVSLENAIAALGEVVPPKRHNLLPINEEALRAGSRFALGAQPVKFRALDLEADKDKIHAVEISENEAPRGF
ncbi:MAG: 2-oxoacid:acceptor oxidoreductase family protein [bacterium]